MSAKALRCLESWHRVMPDYEIKCWDERSFDIDSVRYTREAYAAGKYAFVSDYVRLYALATEGGIYLDTDVEVVKPLDEFLDNQAFAGFENGNRIGTATIGSEPNGAWVTMLLQHYANRKFVLADGSYDTTTNVEFISGLMMGKGMVLNDKRQNVANLLTIYPSAVFCPKDHTNGRLCISPETVCIHHFACSWLPWHKRVRHGIKLGISKLWLR